MKDEQANVRPLLQWLDDALTPVCDWEAVIVDDGSTDGTAQAVRAAAQRDPRIKLVVLRRNFGQSAALQAGFDHAAGDIVATMDGDLQNDPADIPAMLTKLHEGYDVVLGERADRQDAFLLRKVPSACANWLIRRWLRVPFKDFGCTLRVIRREIVDGMQLYGEMHRFITALAVQQGATATQVPVRHHARRAGRSKYGLSRTVRVLLDLLTVKFMASCQTRPMHLFGGIGLALMFTGVVALLSTVLMKYTHGQWMTGNPLLLLSVMLEVMGVQFVSLGLIGEVMARSHFEQSGQRPYLVKFTANLEAAPRDTTEARELKRVA